MIHLALYLPYAYELYVKGCSQIELVSRYLQIGCYQQNLQFYVLTYIFDFQIKSKRQFFNCSFIPLCQFCNYSRPKLFDSHIKNGSYVSKFKLNEKGYA